MPAATTVTPSKFAIGRFLETSSSLGESAGSITWNGPDYEDGVVILRCVFKAEDTDTTATVELRQLNATGSLVYHSFTTTSDTFEATSYTLTDFTSSAFSGTYEARIKSSDSTKLVTLGALEFVIIRSLDI